MKFCIYVIFPKGDLDEGARLEVEICLKKTITFCCLPLVSLTGMTVSRKGCQFVFLFENWPCGKWLNCEIESAATRPLHMCCTGYSVCYVSLWWLLLEITARTSTFLLISSSFTKPACCLPEGSEGACLAPPTVCESGHHNNAVNQTAHNSSIQVYSMCGGAEEFL